MDSQLQDENAEASSLVSGFSLNVASRYPNDVVATALLEQELAQRRQRPNQVRETRKWKQFYEDIRSEATPAEAELTVESELLNQAWKEFVFDPQDKKTANVAKLVSSGTVSMKDLVTAVTNVRDQQKGPGRARRYLSKFLDTLDSHSQILGTLPDQSLYGSIFCGVLKTLISASANYRKIIEALAKDLVEIGEVIESCVLHVQLFSTAEMQDHIKRLYAAVFSFLRQALGWYEDKRRKRLLNSFNENFYSTFSDTIEEIRRIGRVIHKKGMIGNHAETRDVREMVEEVVNNQRERSADDAYWKFQIQKIGEKCDMLLNLEYRRQIGSHMASLLVGEGRNIAPSISIFNSTRSGIPSTYMEWNGLRTFTEPSNAAEAENALPSEIVPGLSANGRPCERTYLKDHLEGSSRTLEEFIYPQLDPIEVYPGSQIFAEHQVVHAIKEWSTSITSQILWLLGPIDRHYPSSLSQISASLITAADEAAIPSMHLFLDWPSNEQDSIFNVLYSLIRQMISLLPEQFASAVDFSPEQFGLLNNQLKSWEAGLAVFNGLLKLVPPLLLLIIDGIDHLDYLTVGASYMDSLLRLLQQHVWGDGEQEPKKTLKILFTTAGNCAALNNLQERGLTVIRISGTQAQQLGKLGRRSGPSRSAVIL